MQHEQSIMLGEMEVKKLLFKLAIPATIAMFANALYNLVDTIFLAWGSGEIAIGALTIVLPFQTLIFAIGLMFGIGASSIFSRAFGRGDKEVMRRSVNSALFFNGVIAITLTVISLIFMDEILVLFGATSINIGYAEDYMFWIVLSLLPFTTSLILNNLARAEGRAKIAMISLLIGALSNVVLDPIFIFDWGLGLGVSGAAIATFIAKMLMLAFILVASLSKKSVLHIDTSSFYSVDFAMLKETVIIGVPTFIRNGLVSFLVIAVNHLINQYAPTEPEIYISVYGVVNRLVAFLLLPGFGLVQGMIPIAGFNYGAQKYDRLKESVQLSTKYLVIYFITVSVIVFFFSRYMMLLFTREANPLFISIGVQAFKIMPFGFLFVGYQFIMSSVYQALGYPVRAFLIALSRQLFIYIPALYILTPIFGIAGIWLTYAVSDGLSGLLSWFVYRFELKIFQKKIDESLTIMPSEMI